MTNTEIAKVTKAAVHSWLLDYAWLGTPDEQTREVACIMAQGDVVSIVDGLTEKYASQANDDKQTLEAQGFALSTLYECHDEPHLATCPRNHS